MLRAVDKAFSLTADDVNIKQPIRKNDLIGSTYQRSIETSVTGSNSISLISLTTNYKQELTDCWLSDMTANYKTSAWHKTDTERREQNKTFQPFEQGIEHRQYRTLHHCKQKITIQFEANADKHFNIYSICFTQPTSSTSNGNGSKQK